MPYVNVASTGLAEINLFYQDIGTGHPIVLVGGWPFGHDMWAYQLHYLTQQGFRCITYDRRGFMRSDRPATGYDYDTLASDLHALVEHLKLEHFSLVGFSMGGGEVIRYCTNYGLEKVKNITLLGSVIPYMLKTPDNPEGVDQSVFDGMKSAIVEDRDDFLEGFTKMFFGVGVLKHPVSDAALTVAKTQAANASITATLACVDSFSSTDFRSELGAITKAVLIIHGTADKNVAIDPSSRQAAKLLPNARLMEWDGEPHGINLTQKVALSEALALFCGSSDLNVVKPLKD